jgi:hypothetical protein
MLGMPLIFPTSLINFGASNGCKNNKRIRKTVFFLSFLENPYIQGPFSKITLVFFL